MSQFPPDSSVVERVEPSPNFDERGGLGRPDMIVLHYTGMQFAHEAINRLCDVRARVSAHYVVVENGSIVQLVPEAKRAWHAGVSSWGGDTDINSRSIGIEISNPGHEFGYSDFPARQIAAVIMLCRTILIRHVIRPENIVGHSDVAPNRKLDPGEKFPWKRLAQSGIGIWVDPGKVNLEALKPNDIGESVTSLQRALSTYGYGLEPSGRYDVATKEVVAAFQRHFRPQQVDGIADDVTQDILRRLLLEREAPSKTKEKQPAQTRKAKPLPPPPKPLPDENPFARQGLPSAPPNAEKKLETREIGPAPRETKPAARETKPAKLEIKRVR
jgi:N-acetylmuramoyl-L-alanine amidase